MNRPDTDAQDQLLQIITFACNARPVHTEGPGSDITHTPGQRALRGNIRFSQSLDTAALEVT